MEPMIFRYLSRCMGGVILFGLMGCASIVPPSGGPKDETPPRMLSIIPADSQFFLRPSRLEMRFDEYVEVRDTRTQIQISPLLDQSLTAHLQGRRVRIQIPDSLLAPETTYRIEFGEAIRDLNEGNPMEPYVYTFSTGGHFDSLVLAGEVIDARWGRADSNAQVLLFPGDLADSLWLRTRPAYVTKVENGRFHLDGLPDRPFLVMALRDANANLLYDADGEAIGFLPEAQRPGRAEDNPLEILLFEENSPETQKKDKGKKGAQMGKQSSPRPVKELPFDYLPQVDTTDLQKRSLDLTRPLEIQFTRPVASISESRLRLYRDSLGESLGESFRLRLDTADSMKVYLETEWKEDQVYILGFQAGFALDSNQEETKAGRYRFRTRRASDYGLIRLSLPPALVDKGYLLRLDRGEDSFFLSPIHVSDFQWTYLEPGPYRFYLVEDRNSNGIWDTGDLWERRQPERVYPLGEPIDLKAGWELQFDHDAESLPPILPRDIPKTPTDSLGR